MHKKYSEGDIIKHSITFSIPLIFGCKNGCKSCNHLIYTLICGDGRTRTAVQTKYRKAFYMLIPPLIVGPDLPEGRPTGPYPLGLSALQRSRRKQEDSDDIP